MFLFACVCVCRVMNQTPRLLPTQTGESRLVPTEGGVQRRGQRCLVAPLANCWQHACLQLHGAYRPLAVSSCVLHPARAFVFSFFFFFSRLTARRIHPRARSRRTCAPRAQAARLAGLADASPLLSLALPLADMRFTAAGVKAKVKAKGAANQPGDTGRDQGDGEAVARGLWGNGEVRVGPVRRWLTGTWTDEPPPTPPLPLLHTSKASGSVFLQRDAVLTSVFTISFAGRAMSP
jgi:hypothetical protein